MDKEIILASPPETVKNALLWGLPAAHMAYKTDGSYLYRSPLPDALRRGFMLLTNAKETRETDRERICRLVIDECKTRSYEGVICDFYEPCAFARRLLVMLAGELNRCRIKFYVSEWTASFVKSGYIIVSSAMSGGNLRSRLCSLIKTYGAERLALDLEIVTRDFLLPSPGGEGRKITRKRADELLDKSGASVFSSSDLCCKYFNYRSDSGQHFVLFDDTESIEMKVRLAKKLGIRKFFLLYPETTPDIIKACINT